jgi:1,4-beta-D-xylan synthase
MSVLPPAYFFFVNKLLVDLIWEWQKVKREYDEFKVRVNSLPEAIRRCSDACNDGEELCVLGEGNRRRQRQQEHCLRQRRP